MYYQTCMTLTFVVKTDCYGDNEYKSEITISYKNGVCEIILFMINSDKLQYWDKIIESIDKGNYYSTAFVYIWNGEDDDVSLTFKYDSQAFLPTALDIRRLLEDNGHTE